MVIVKNIANEIVEKISRKIVKKIALSSIFLVTGLVTLWISNLTIERLDILSIFMGACVGSFVGILLYGLYVIIFGE